MTTLRESFWQVIGQPAGIKYTEKEHKQTGVAGVNPLLPYTLSIIALSADLKLEVHVFARTGHHSCPSVFGDQISFYRLVFHKSIGDPYKSEILVPVGLLPAMSGGSGASAPGVLDL